MFKREASFILLSALYLFRPSFAAELTVPQVLQLAEHTSPDLKASMDREAQARDTVAVLQSFYYPTVALEAIDSFGFPGSTSALGITGLMGSPFRSGPAAGVVANLNLFDWKRHYLVQGAGQELKVAREETNVLRFRLDQNALQIFFDASRFRGQEEAAKLAVTAINQVAHEVNRFVQTGQRSVVERLLVQDQIMEAEMNAAAFHERYSVALERLSTATGIPAQQLSCPLPVEITESSMTLEGTPVVSPLIARAIAEASSAQVGISAASASRWPVLAAMASVGDMDRSRLGVDKKEYSGGFGLVLPLFEGYRINKEVQRAQALASEKENDVMAARLALEDMNDRYDEIINASRVKLTYLSHEQDMAQQALKLARSRYFSFSGTLVDVREALRNFERVEVDINDVKTDLLLALGSKALLDGGRRTNNPKG